MTQSRPMMVRAADPKAGWGKAVDPATGRKIYLSVGRAPLSRQTAFLRKAHRTRDAAVRYSQRFQARMVRMVGASVSLSIYNKLPWYIKLYGKVRQWWWKVRRERQ